MTPIKNEHHLSVMSMHQFFLGFPQASRKHFAFSRVSGHAFIPNQRKVYQSPNPQTCIKASALTKDWEGKPCQERRTKPRKIRSTGKVESQHYCKYTYCLASNPQMMSNDFTPLLRASRSIDREIWQAKKSRRLQLACPLACNHLVPYVKGSLYASDTFYLTIPKETRISKEKE